MRHSLSGHLRLCSRRCRFLNVTATPTSPCDRTPPRRIMSAAADMAAAPIRSLRDVQFLLRGRIPQNGARMIGQIVRLRGGVGASKMLASESATEDEEACAPASALAQRYDHPPRHPLAPLKDDRCLRRKPGGGHAASSEVVHPPVEAAPTGGAKLVDDAEASRHERGWATAGPSSADAGRLGGGHGGPGPHRGIWRGFSIDTRTPTRRRYA